MTTGRRFLGTPLVLRFVLGAVFLWAGVPKVFMNMDLSPEQAAVLANMGAIDGPSQLALPTPDPASAPDSDEAAPLPTPDDQAPDEQSLPSDAGTDDASPDEAAGADDQSQPQAHANPTQSHAVVLVSSPVAGSIDADASVQFSPDDFVETVQVPRLYGLVFLMNNLAQPKQADQPGIQVLPTSLANNGTMLKMLAWSAGLTEFIAGVFVLLGVLTRLSSFALAGTMIAALWMTMVGPAIGTPDAIFGFLPEGLDAPPGTPLHGKYSTLMLQLMTFGVAFALVFIGGGLASIDNFLFGRSKPSPQPQQG